MKNKLKTTIALAASALLATGCIEVYEPQTSYADSDQMANAPGVYDSYVSTCTSTLVGTYMYGTGTASHFDIGYPSFFLFMDTMGQDLIPSSGNSQYGNSYTASQYLGEGWAYSQLPWTCYYKWINNCNTVLKMAGDSPSTEHKPGAGIAYAMRAMFYMDLARMYQFTYVADKQAETVPIVTEKSTNLANNPRATQEKMWAFILEDLDKAEEYLADYQRTDKTVPDLSVVYGLKARAYLITENFEKAEEYAKKAQAGYSALSEAEALDHYTGFNTPNDAWMFCMTLKDSDPMIKVNDSDTNWGSQMFSECYASGCLYASSYGDPKRIDAHLYETIPATDYRKNWFVDPAVDSKSTLAEKVAFLAPVSDYGESLVNAGLKSTEKTAGYIQLKFRAGGGVEGRSNAYKATVVSIPLMRVEEMMLIEAEAAGMQETSRGKALLETFAKMRDASYAYDETKPFRDNVWWQRRVELWGEGFATYDLKRLQKGITRSYAGTNHTDGYRWNLTTVPGWTNPCIPTTELMTNLACSQNPAPNPPSGNSPEQVW